MRNKKKRKRSKERRSRLTKIYKLKEGRNSQSLSSFWKERRSLQISGAYYLRLIKNKTEIGSEVIFVDIVI